MRNIPFDTLSASEVAEMLGLSDRLAESYDAECVFIYDLLKNSYHNFERIMSDCKELGWVCKFIPVSKCKQTRDDICTLLVGPNDSALDCGTEYVLASLEG